MPYELVTLTGPLLKLSDIAAAARAWTADGKTGALLGSWRTDIGPLGQVLLLRGFETADELVEERRRALLSRNPFNGDGLLDRCVQESYEPFPFLLPVTPREAGGVYEFRTYFLKPGGLPVTMDAWREAIGPAHEYTDHLVVNMFALDGPPRVTHIWGFHDIQQRVELRERHYAAGLWPPRGGPEQIDHALSVIALSNVGSPLS